MNKNYVIFILVLSTLLGSIWGSVAHRQKISLEEDLAGLRAEKEKLNTQASREREQVLGKTAGLQDTLAEKEEQLQKARSELVTLRKSAKAVESQLSECTATLQEMNQKNESYIKEIEAARNAVAALKATIEQQKKRVAESGQAKEPRPGSPELTGPEQAPAVDAKDREASEPEGEPESAAGQKKQEVNRTAAEPEKGEQGSGAGAQEPGAETEDKDAGKPAAGGNNEKVLALLAQLQMAAGTVDELRDELDACNAQIIGMEKLVDEKNAAMDETSREMDRLQINMDVLLSKIADQRDSLQELQEENRVLAEEMAAKNEEIADLQQKIMEDAAGRKQEGQ
jgi:chromosome segregation ATPase